MRAAIDEGGNELVLTLTQEDKDYLVVLGIQYCLNAGITEIGNKPIEGIVADLNAQIKPKALN